MRYRLIIITCIQLLLSSCTPEKSTNTAVSWINEKLNLYAEQSWYHSCEGNCFFKSDLKELNFSVENCKLVFKQRYYDEEYNKTYNTGLLSGVFDKDNKYFRTIVSHIPISTFDTAGVYYREPEAGKRIYYLRILSTQKNVQTAQKITAIKGDPISKDSTILQSDFAIKWNDKEAEPNLIPRLNTAFLDIVAAYKSKCSEPY